MVSRLVNFEAAVLLTMLAVKFCGSVAVSIEAGPATGALTRGTATHGSSNPAGCCCGISNIRVLGMWRRACIMGSCCSSSQWHPGAFISAIPENLSQRRKHCARNSCTQRRPVYGAAALKSTVGNANRNPDRFSKGRQWSGRPVRDNAVLHPHSDIAQPLWSSVLDPGDVVVDATCGNGNDSLYLVRALANAGGGTLHACDIQACAISSSQALLKRELPTMIDWILPQQHGNGQVRVQWEHRSHLELLQSLPDKSVRVVAFNLGYLPGGDKDVVTEASTTIDTVVEAQRVLQDGGAISLTCYPGHLEGQREEELILDHMKTLPMGDWSCYFHQWVNNRNKRTGKRAPTLAIIQKV